MHDMYDWVVRPEISTEKACLKLKVVPYDGIVVILGRIDIFDDGNFRFEYLVVDNPDSIDYEGSIEFHKYLERIISEILRVKRNELEKSVTNSG